MFVHKALIMKGRLGDSIFRNNLSRRLGGSAVTGIRIDFSLT